MAAHALVDPVADIQGAIGTNGDVGWSEERFDRPLGGRVAADEVRPGILLLHVRGHEDLPVETEACALGNRLIGKDLVPPRLGRQEGPVPRRPHRAVLVENVAGWRSAAVDVPGRRHAGIVLAPLRYRNRLAGPAVCLPGPLAIVRREAEVGIFHHPGHAGSRRVVVVVLEHVAQRGDRLLVAVAVVRSDDLRVGAVGVHPHREPAHVHVPVVARLAGELRRVVRVLEGTDLTRTIGTENPERLAGLVGEHRAAIAGVEHPLAVGTDRHRVQRVVVVDAHEPGQQHLALVHGRIELQVAVDVGIDDEVRRLRDHYLVVDHRDAERRDQRRLLHEGVGAVSLAVAVFVLQHDDAVAFGLTGVMGAVADALGHPDPAVAIDVDVGRVEQHRRRGPQGDLEAVGDLEDVERNLDRLAGPGLTGRPLWRRRLRRRRLSRRRLSGLYGMRSVRLLRRDGHEHHHEHCGQRRDGGSTHRSFSHDRFPDRPPAGVGCGPEGRGARSLNAQLYIEIAVRGS